MRKRTLCALLLLALLAAFAVLAGRTLRAFGAQLDRQLAQAQALAEADRYAEAKALYRNALQAEQQHEPLLTLLVRRNLLDQLVQTLATLPCYADVDHTADLAVETARARIQLSQLCRSFFRGL